MCASISMVVTRARRVRTRAGDEPVLHREPLPPAGTRLYAVARQTFQRRRDRSATGTHAGTYLGLPPTGRRFCVSAFGAWQFEHDRCAEQWLQLDLVELFQQLGAELVFSTRPLASD